MLFLFTNKTTTLTNNMNGAKCSFFSAVNNIVKLSKRFMFVIHHQQDLVSCTRHSSALNLHRYKSKNRKSNAKQSEDGSDSDSDNEDNQVVGKGVEVKTNVVSSMRIDLLLKVGLGLARNKIEEAFYESRLRVNSKKISKKSAQVRVGDEVDLIKGVSPSNPQFILVGRIEILGARPREELGDIQVKLRRSKALLIDNYPDGDPWKQSQSSDERS